MSWGKNINALILAGGESLRMGMDKGELVYHQKAQKYHLADMLIAMGLPTYISIKKTIVQSNDYHYVVDKIEDIGPMAGIHAAFTTFNTAWLVLACDYPLLTNHHLETLLKHRDKSKVATLFYDEMSNQIIPTLAIYEPKFFQLLSKAIAQKNYGIQYLLRQHDIALVSVQGEELRSIDTQADCAQIKKIINGKSIH